ncbi:MAG TPA: glycosyltransferase family 2 protein [Anaerolineales bacterium]|nr:glycosyltransferase family 2 protein [Anaerolineales bacterium]
MSPETGSGLDRPPRVAVVIPCLNEERTIAKVVQDFRAELPEADIVVFDNGSTDQTAEAAAEAGAILMSEKRRGKGFVVHAMFQKVDADIYIMVDGDDTYPADRARALLEPVWRGEADMAIGSRIMAESSSEIKFLNWIGNNFFRRVINLIFRTNLTDILSGYRCMNRRLVKSLPLFVKGFEVEAEITIKSLERGFRLVEVPVDLRSRMEGSASKIRVLRDGLSILGTIFSLFRDYKPLTFFGSLGLMFLGLGLIPGAYAAFGAPALLQTLPLSSLMVSIALILIGTLFISVGLILHTVNRRFQEMEHLLQLSDPWLEDR